MTHKPTPLYSLRGQGDYRRMPWKNGLGETLEIERMEDDTGVLFRISQASVAEDGLFSDFSGLHRTLVLIQGSGMTLTHTSPEGMSLRHDLQAELDMAWFSGEDSTYSTLKDGPIEDLNIMVREGELVSRVGAVTDSQPFEFHRSKTGRFSGFYARTECELMLQALAEDGPSANPERVTVPENATLRFDAPLL